MQEPHEPNPSATSAGSPSAEIGAPQSEDRETVGHKTARLSAWLRSLNPDFSDAMFQDAVRTVHTEMDGDPHGLDILDWTWRKSDNYPGRDVIQALWDAIGSEPDVTQTIDVEPAITSEFGSPDTIGVNGLLDIAQDQQSPMGVSSDPEGDGTPAAPQATDDEVISRLALLPQMEFDRCCKTEAKKLGVKASTLEKLVKAARTNGSETAWLPFPEVEPWPDPIDPAQVLDEINDVILRFVVMDQEQADAVTLWNALTWFIDAVEVLVLLIITAPERACAKSQLLTLVGYLAARPLSVANSTASFLFRAITVWRPTLLIDEADQFMKENDELKGLVNAGHTRANAFVGRTVAVGDGYEPRLFDVWGAKAFAGISLEKHLPDTTMSRGIVINLRRKLPHEKVDRLRHADKAAFAATASKLARFSEDYCERVRAAKPVLPDELNDRAQDNWEPLLAIAACAGPEWLARATKAALVLSKAGSDSVNPANELLADIQCVFARKNAFKISTVDLIEALVADDEKAWATFNYGKPLTPRQLAKLLAAYGIKSKTVRLSNSTPKGYDADQFADAFARYLSTPEKLPQQRNAAPDPMNDNASGVADETQRSTD